MLKFTPDEIKKIAQQACNDARKYIHKGSTQLVNNSYDIFQRQALLKAMNDLRDAVTEAEKYSFEINAEFYKLYYNITLCKKLSLGNCDELTLLALDYVIQHYPTLNAEFYYIKGGDHGFLVLGKQQESQANKPETWGECAYICDPWSNMIYPVSEYKEKLKNYYFNYITLEGIQVRQNYTEDFNQKLHQLKKYKYYSIDHLRAMHSKESMQKIEKLFECKINLLLDNIDVFQYKLTIIAIELEKKYSSSDEKIEIINNLITKVQQAKIDIKTTLNNQDNYQDYFSYPIIAETNLKQGLKNYNKIMRITAEDKKIINQYRNPESIKTKILCFFNQAPRSAKKLNSALKNSQAGFKKIFKS